MAPVAVITGTTHGIGRVTALGLARAGYRVVMLCRDLPSSLRTAEGIRTQAPGATIDSVYCDLAQLETIRAAAERIITHYPPPSLLINNAGVATMRGRRTAAGMDYNFAVNHLGHFLLTELLRPFLAPAARIIIVASRAHYRGTLELAAVADPHERIGATHSYARSKLANVLHCLALARRLAGSSRTVNCLHPGIVATNLLPGWLVRIKRLLGSTMFDEERGAATTLHLALSPDMGGTSGRYFDECNIAQAPSALSQDVALQEALWQRSLAWTESIHPPASTVRR